MGLGDNFVYSKRDIILAGVTVGIVVVTLGLGFGLQKGASLPGTNCWKAQSNFFLAQNKFEFQIRGFKIEICKAYPGLLT